MAKQNELKNLVRGKGLEALNASSAGEAPEEIVVIIGPKPKDGEKPVEPKFEITEIVPSEDDLRIIQEITGGKENYFVVWAAYTSEGEAAQSNFGLGKPITFKINCTTSKLLIQLGAPYRIEIITFDARTQRPEKLYSLVEDQQLKAAYFQISYMTETSLKGLFKLQAILSIPQTDIFQVYEGNYFQVS